MTRLEVQHTTIYRYARPVRFGPHRAMLRPRDSHDLKLRSATLTVSPRPQVSWMHDVFGNSITLLEFAAAGGRAAGRELDRDRAVRPRPARYQLAADAEHWPFAYDAEDRRDLGPTLERHYPDEGGKVRAWALRAAGRAASSARSSC